MKKTNAKLKVSAETIRLLDHKQLLHAAGGAPLTKIGCNTDGGGGGGVLPTNNCRGDGTVSYMCE